MIKKIIMVIVLMLVVFSLFGCNKKLNKYTKNYFVFGTEIEIDIYAKTNDIANNYFIQTNAILNEYNMLTDRFIDYANVDGIYKINQNAGSVTHVDSKLIDLIEYSIEKESLLLNDDNLPYFTIGIGKVSDIYEPLFDEYNLKSIDSSSISIDLDIDIETDTSKIIIDKENDTILIPSNMSLDLGGVAKGYVVEILRKYYDSNNVNYVIDAGNSSIITNYGNPNRTNNEFKIGLKNPMLESGSLVYGVLSLPLNMAASTSAYYQKYIKVDGKIWSSILDPYTKKPVDTDILSITVLMNDASIGDITSTILYMAGYDKAISYIESNTDVEGIIYKSDGLIYVSPGLLDKVELS